MLTTAPQVRNGTVAGLRLLAKELAADERIPLPLNGFSLYALADSREEVLDVAQVLGVPVTTDRNEGQHGDAIVRVMAARDFGAVRYIVEWITVEDKPAKAA